MPAGPEPTMPTLQPLPLDVGGVVPFLGDRLVADKPLEPPDRHRFQGVTDRADALAEIFLRADPAADRRQERRVGEDVVGAAEILLGDFDDEPGDVDVDRTGRNAFGCRTDQAAVALDDRVRVAEAKRDFIEILRAHDPDPESASGSAPAGWCGRFSCPFTSPAVSVAMPPRRRLPGS